MIWYSFFDIQVIIAIGKEISTTNRIDRKTMNNYYYIILSMEI